MGDETTDAVIHRQETLARPDGPAAAIEGRAAVTRLVSTTRGPCRGTTRAGTPCRRRTVLDASGEGQAAGYCRQHSAVQSGHAPTANGPEQEQESGHDTGFYGRGLRGPDLEHYMAALAQEGLAQEVALLRLYLLDLVSGHDPARCADIPRVVHALARALHDGGRRRAGDSGGAHGQGADLALDAMVREEGRRLLDDDAAGARASVATDLPGDADAGLDLRSCHRVDRARETGGGNANG